MKGSIISRGNSYRLRVPLGKNPSTGKYENYFETFKGTKGEAQKRLRELLSQLDKGAFVKPARLTVANFLKTWLADYVQLKESTRTAELYTYMSEKHIIPTIGNILLSSLKPQHLQHLYSEKIEHGRLDGKGGLGPRTVELMHVIIHKALEYAMSPGMNLIPWNIADAATSPRVPRREMKILSELDVRLFLESVADSQYYVLFYTYLHTAARRSELLALQWSNVDLLGCVISITRALEYINEKKIPPKDRFKFGPPKTPGSRRLIDLTPSNTLLLREHMETRKQFLKSLNPKFDPEKDFDQNELVFCHVDGSPYLPSSITHAWTKAARKAGFKGVRLHDARHTHASIMLKKGVHPKIVQERLGHSSIRTTLDTYSHVAPGLQKAAAAKFDEIAARQESQLDQELKEIVQN